VRQLRREPRRESAPRSTPAGLLKGLGRVALWSVVVLLLLRGAADLLAVEPTAPATPAPRAAAVTWPDDEARAFAVEFARAYLSWSPRRPSEYERGLQGFVSPELATSLVPELAGRGPDQTVQAATVARTATVDAQRALVTVAATVDAARLATRYLTVPVARDGQGGLVVYDLPSLAAPPARGDVSVPEVEPLRGVDRAAIEDVLTRFFRAFLAGRADELEYLVPPGVRIGALGEPHRLEGLVSIAQLGPPGRDGRDVLATVQARDEATRAVYSLRYRVRLVRRDRWYVAAVNNATRKEG
jgi:Conjugative transposon protein TcpC